jgi:hypothetical protein
MICSPDSPDELIDVRRFRQNSRFHLERRPQCDGGNGSSVRLPTGATLLGVRAAIAKELSSFSF